jgi:hypothetical protein
MGEPRGYEAAKRVLWRKRMTPVDSLAALRALLPQACKYGRSEPHLIR